MAYLLKINNTYYLCEKIKVNNRWRLKKKAISSDKRIALQVLLQYQKEKDLKNFNLSNPDKSWDEFIEEYLKYSKANKSPRSYQRDQITLEHFGRLFSLNTIKDFTPQVLEEYKIKRLEEGVLKETVNRELNTLKNLGTKLVEWGYLSINPVKPVKKFPTKKNKKIRFLTKEEIDLILKHATGQLKTAIMLSLYTGMRAGEVCHLEWKDIDFNKKVITIEAKDDWKPKDSELRIIPLQEKLEKFLLSLNHKNKECKILDIDEDTLSSLMRKLVKKLKIKDASFHTLRHTFASHLAMQGVDLYTIAKLLGHASVETTEIYAHLSPQHFQDIIKKLPY